MKNEEMKTRIDTYFNGKLTPIDSTTNELTFELDKENLLEVLKEFCCHKEFKFEQLIDLCGIDYLTYGSDEWITQTATNSGFSRGVSRQPVILDDADSFDERRFAVIYHLLSIENNSRLRLKVFTGSSNPPTLPSASDIWGSANWLEREAFDLYGILFEGHPDLRRILTDYGFVGHPFRKDFPVSGNVEIYYDEKKEKIVYKPVSIEPRTLVPRVIRSDNRYSDDLKDATDE